MLRVVTSSIEEGMSNNFKYFTSVALENLYDSADTIRDLAPAKGVSKVEFENQYEKAKKAIEKYRDWVDRNILKG